MRIISIFTIICVCIFTLLICSYAQSTDPYDKVKQDLENILDNLTPSQIQELQNLLQKQNNSTPDSVKDTNVIYSIESLDLSVDKLPQFFAGQDPEKIYNILTTKFAPKEEFETTKQYKSRIKIEKQKPVLNNLYLDDVFVTKIDHSNDNYSGKAKMVFDADRQVLQITTYLSPIKSGDIVDRINKNIQSTRVKTVEKLKGSYVGENAFGIKRNVLEVEENDYFLIFNNPEDFGIVKGTTITSHEFEVPLEPEIAKTAKSNIQTLLFYKLVEPFTQDAQSHISASINSPKDIQYNYRYINGRVVEIWFYNYDTGEIYLKLKPTIK